MTVDELLTDVARQIRAGHATPATHDMTGGACAFRADGTPTWWRDPACTHVCVGGALLRALNAPPEVAPVPPPGIPETGEPFDWAIYSEAIRRIEDQVAGLDYGRFNDGNDTETVAQAVERA